MLKNGYLVSIQNSLEMALAAGVGLDLGVLAVGLVFAMAACARGFGWRIFGANRKLGALLPIFFGSIFVPILHNISFQ